LTRSLSAENLAALQGRRVVARDFLWLVVKDRSTGEAVFDGEWSDIGEFTCDVIDPETGGSTERTFFGSGTLIKCSDVPLVSTIVVQNVSITLSQVNDRVADLIRTYECKQGRVELHRGLFDLETRELVSPAVCRFVGFIDEIDINTPTEGEDGSVVLTCVSHTQEMTRSNPDTRSDASQRIRAANDNFYQDTAVVSEWQHFWGSSSGEVATTIPGIVKSKVK
jgi:hypothetical protein